MLTGASFGDPKMNAETKFQGANFDNSDLSKVYIFLFFCILCAYVACVHVLVSNEFL